MTAPALHDLFRTAIQLALALIAGIAAAPAALGQTTAGSQALSDALRDFAVELRVAAACHLDTAPVFRIWPLDGEKIPVSEASAARIYGAILAEISLRKPGCAVLMDAAGASTVLIHLIEHGTYRVPGEDPRDDMDATFRNADYFILLDLQDVGQTIQAGLKLTTQDAALLASMPPFPVPAALVDTGCGDGAVPLDTAIARAAKRLVDDAPGIRMLVDSAGHNADPVETSGFETFAGRLLVDAILQAGMDHVNQRSIALAPDALAADDVYHLDLRSWPCSGGDRLVLSARLRNGSGFTASWKASVLASSVPEGVIIYPSGHEPMWALSVTPREVHPNRAIAIVAEVPEICDPAFLILSPSGVATELQGVFVVTDRPDGTREFRSDASTPWGIGISPDDEKGAANVGFACLDPGVQVDDRSLDQLRRDLASGAQRRFSDPRGRRYWFNTIIVR